MTVYIHFNIGSGKESTRLHNVASVQDNGMHSVRPAATLERAGATPAPTDGDVDALRAWLPGALRAATRTVRHPGNHRYAWPLDRRLGVRLPSQPYPKWGVR